MTLSTDAGAAATQHAIPVVDYLVLGEPSYLEANECAVCAALFLDRRNACARCGWMTFRRRPLASTGTVRAYTVVHRAPPHVPTPFAAGIIDLDGGGAVKANIVGVTDPHALGGGLRVRMVTYPAGEDQSGTQAIAFAYAPG